MSRSAKAAAAVGAGGGAAETVAGVNQIWTSG